MKHAVDVSVWLLLCSGMLAAACGDGGAPPSSAPEASPVDARAETDAKAEADARAKAEADARAKAEADARAKAEADARAKAEAAEAEATMKILEAAKAAADAHAKPGTLFDALRWADKDEGGRSTIDVIETFGPPDEPDLVLRLAEVYDGPDGIATALPPEAPLPPGFALEDEWLVITTAGARRGKATAFGAYFGASESHFIVVLDVEATGLAVPARRWKGRVPKLRKAKAIDLRTPEAQEWLALVGPAIAASASDGKSTKVLTSKPLTPKTTRVVEGRFPGGFTRLVSIAMPVRRVTRIGEEHVAGLVLADDTGRVEAVHAPGLTLDSYDVSFLVDLEGDGQDEVIYESSYYEGNYRLVLAWNAAGTALHRSLGGDGA